MRARIIRLLALIVFVSFAVIVVYSDGQPQKSGNIFSPTIPKTWEEAALSDWATPVAGLNARPAHISASEYYSLPVENLRTYPVYLPGREPEGYWKMIQSIGPQPLIEPEKLKTEADWVAAGKRVFDESDQLALRTLDAGLIALARNRETFDKSDAHALPDGTFTDLRWVPTKRGVALTVRNCSGCHTLYRADGTAIPGAPSNAELTRTGKGIFYKSTLVSRIEHETHVLTGGPPFFMGEEPFAMWLYRAYGVPWIKDDVNERLKGLTEDEYTALVGAVRRGGGVVRWNGSLFYPATIPDLIGIKDRKYLDHTATHLHRGIGDLMRYAALVSFADSADFGPYHMLGQATKRIGARLSDEALYALALYLYSLTPPLNPNRFDENARAGEKIFAREGCTMCHAPPLYTSNKLTLARGFTPAKDRPATLDILALSVGTDPGLALATRKGTGYYKVPSLKGLWYRGHYLHDGSVASLEEMFDPDRLKEGHAPGGWCPPGTQTRAIKGHEFGLSLSNIERRDLIAFLRTL